MIKKWAVAAGIVAVSLTPSVTHAQAEDDGIYPPGEEKSIDVTAFDSFCQDDAPYVGYDIETHGFDPAGHTATLTITDINGELIETLENMPLTGSFLYPGASIDDAGRPTDWPGWVNENGVWREQTVDEPGSDYILRLGLNIRADVDTTTAFVDPPVTYPGANPVCVPGPTGVSPTGVTPAAAAPAQASLPSTGSDATSALLRIGALLVAAGGLLAIGTHRRRSASAS